MSFNTRFEIMIAAVVGLLTADHQMKAALGQATPIPASSANNENVVTFVYDPESGNLSFNSSQKLTIVDVRSNACRLRSENLTSPFYGGLFDVRNACKIFEINPGGFDVDDMGDILPIGLSTGEVQADLRVGGALLGDGAFGYPGSSTEVYFYDGRYDGGIFRWLTGELISGTEDVYPRPGASLNNQELAYAIFPTYNLNDSTFENSNLFGARFVSTDLTNVNFTNARITDADFSSAVALTKDQFYSTASYQQRRLESIGLSGIDLTGWDFASQNIVGDHLSGATITDTDFTGAEIADADFRDTKPGLTWDQLRSTASFRNKNLEKIRLPENAMQGWNLADQKLSSANLGKAILNDASLVNANLSGATLMNAELNNADLSGADLRNAEMVTPSFPSARFSSDTIYNQWTGFRVDFDPSANGLTFVRSELGDFDSNDVLDAADIDFLSRVLADNYRFDDSLIIGGSWRRLDVNEDHFLDAKDRVEWIKQVRRTWYGDANLDGEFDSSDLMLVAQAGEYEDMRIHNSTWATGDWNGDFEFTSRDLVAAFQDGGYEFGRRTEMQAVPEPTDMFLFVLGISLFYLVHRKRATSS